MCFFVGKIGGRVSEGLIMDAELQTVNIRNLSKLNKKGDLRPPF